MELYNWHDWPRLFPVEFYEIASTEMEKVISDTEFQIYSSPGKHFIPSIGLRIEPSKGKIVAYTGDGEPCPSILQLARGADILLHESTDKKQGHSTPEQAGQVARNAGVRTLYLIHYPSQAGKNGDFKTRAGTEFTGEIKLADDFMTIDLN